MSYDLGVFTIFRLVFHGVLYCDLSFFENVSSIVCP